MNAIALAICNSEMISIIIQLEIRISSSRVFFNKK